MKVEENYIEYEWELRTEQINKLKPLSKVKQAIIEIMQDDERFTKNLNPDINFLDIFNTPYLFYDLMNSGESVQREFCFTMCSKIFDVDYDEIMNRRLSKKPYFSFNI